MKDRINYKIIFLLICFCTFASAIVAQEKAVAYKFAEYNDETANLRALSDKAESFGQRLGKEPQTTKGFIAYFRGSSLLNRYESRYNQVHTLLHDFAAENVNRIDEKTGLQWGGRSQNRSKFARVEFWIVPQDAELPDIRSNECGLCQCPLLEVQGEKFVENKNQIATFTANVSGGGQDDIEYAWKVSEGVIIEGQGTPVIKVDFSRSTAKEAKITIEVDGVCDECPQEESLTTVIQQ